jgi:hypothetical protein
MYIHIGTHARARARAGAGAGAGAHAHAQHARTHARTHAHKPQPGVTWGRQSLGMLECCVSSSTVPSARMT